MPYNLRFPDYNTVSIDEFTRMCDDLNQDNDIICPVLISTRHDTAIVATIPSRISAENPGAVQALLGAGIDVRIFDLSTGDLASPSVSPPPHPINVSPQNIPAAESDLMKGIKMAAVMASPKETSSIPPQNPPAKPDLAPPPPSEFPGGLKSKQDYRVSELLKAIEAADDEVLEGLYNVNPSGFSGRGLDIMRQVNGLLLDEVKRRRYPASSVSPPSSPGHDLPAEVEVQSLTRGQWVLDIESGKIAMYSHLIHGGGEFHGKLHCLIFLTGDIALGCSGDRKVIPIPRPIFPIDTTKIDASMIKP